MSPLWPLEFFFCCCWLLGYVGRVSSVPSALGMVSSLCEHNKAQVLSAGLQFKTPWTALGTRAHHRPARSCASLVLRRGHGEGFVLAQGIDRAVTSAPAWWLGTAFSFCWKLYAGLSHEPWTFSGALQWAADPLSLPPQSSHFCGFSDLSSQGKLFKGPVVLA